MKRFFIVLFVLLMLCSFGCSAGQWLMTTLDGDWRELHFNIDNITEILVTAPDKSEALLISDPAEIESILKNAKQVSFQSGNYTPFDGTYTVRIYENDLLVACLYPEEPHLYNPAFGKVLSRLMKRLKNGDYNCYAYRISVPKGVHYDDAAEYLNKCGYDTRYFNSNNPYPYLILSYFACEEDMMRYSETELTKHCTLGTFEPDTCLAVFTEELCHEGYVKSYSTVSEKERRYVHGELEFIKRGIYIYLTKYLTEEEITTLQARAEKASIEWKYLYTGFYSEACEDTLLLSKSPIDESRLAAIETGLASSTSAYPAPTHEAEPAAPSIEPLDREVPFLPSEHRDSWWADAGSEYHRYTRYLDVDQAGSMTLHLNDLSFLVTPKDGDTYLLSAELSENLYSDPVDCIRLGEIRLWTDNATVRVELLKDRYAIFTGLSEADLSMSYQKTHHEWQYYDWPDVAPSSLPAEQPHTDWVTMFYTGDIFNRLELHSDESGQVRGTLIRERERAREVESEIPCALLTGSRYACVVQYDESGYGEPLLFGSLVSPLGSVEWQKKYVTLCILPLYCVYGAVEPHDPYYLAEDSENSGILKCIKETFDTGCDAGVFDVYEALEAGDYRLSMGVDRIVAEYYLCQSGWMRINPQPESDRWYRVYQKSGDTLVLVFDDELTEYGLTKYIVGYLCYDIDGAVKAWGGLKPLDHVFVDSYEFKKDESDFQQTAGVRGYFLTDHDMLYFTDDMRLIFVTQFNGDYAIEVDPILPASNSDT